MAAPIHRRIGLRHEEVLFAISGKIFDLIGHPSLFHFPIGRLDETKLIDTRKRAHRTDQSDVWPFGRLDRTYASIMRRVNVAHLEPGTLPTETSGTESRQTALMR